MSHRNCTRLEKSAEVSALSAQLWIAGEYDERGFEAAIQGAGKMVDSLLRDADDWDAAAARERQLLDDYAADWDLWAGGLELDGAVRRRARSRCMVRGHRRAAAARLAAGRLGNTRRLPRLVASRPLRTP